MKDLVVRLSALDPDAGAAVRVIAYFDQLVDARAGLATIVRGAAVLAGCPARLAYHVGPATPPIPDVLALEQAAAAAPWMLSTLYAVATNASLRAASAALRVHHSTLQDRIVHAERLLGWPVREPQGQFRLHLALVLYRLHHHPAESGA